MPHIVTLLYGPRLRGALAALGLLLCFWFLAWPGMAQGSQALRFALVVTTNPPATIREFTPLLQWMEKNTGQPVRLILYQRQEQLIDAIAQQQVDLAYIGPLPYVHLRARHPEAEPLLRWREADGALSYRCVLVAFRGDARRLADLRRQAIGLTQPLSTCGPLAVDALLRQYAGFGLEQTRPIFLHTHDEVALATVAGEVAAGGMRDAQARRYAPVGLEVLARGAPLPGFALVANRATLGAAMVQQLQQLLLATPQATYRHWGQAIRHGMVPAADSDYDPMRAMVAASPRFAPAAAASAPVTLQGQG